MTRVMNKTQKIATITLATAALAGTVIYLLHRKKHQKKLAVISNAGYEMAYDVHFPVKYKRRG
jgi:hypothetical protein